jgi:carboxymethylenebutenolidase
MADDGKPFETEGGRALSRRGFGGLSIAAGLAVAGRAAADPLDDVVTMTDVEVKTSDGMADAALFTPKAKGTYPAVLIWTDALGLRPAFRDMGKRLASSGYVVLVPNPFYRSKRAPVFDDSFSFQNPADMAKLGELRKPMTPDAVIRDATAFVAFLDAQPKTNRKKKAGVVGYCMGGPLTMQTAAAVSSRIGAGCSFHGGGLVTDRPDSPHLLVPKIKAAYVFGIAVNDDERQPDAKDKLRAAFDAAHLPASIEVYPGTMHGWCVKGSAVYNEPQAERAWAAMLALYKARLA